MVLRTTKYFTDSSMMCMIMLFLVGSSFALVSCNTEEDKPSKNKSQNQPAGGEEDEDQDKDEDEDKDKEVATNEAGDSETKTTTETKQDDGQVKKIEEVTQTSDDGVVTTTTNVVTKDEKGEILEKKNTKQVVDQQGNTSKTETTQIKTKPPITPPAPIITPKVPEEEPKEEDKEKDKEKDNRSKTIKIGGKEVRIIPRLRLYDVDKGSSGYIHLAELLAWIKGSENKTIYFTLCLQFEKGAPEVVVGPITSIKVIKGGENMLKKMDPTKNLRLHLDSGIIGYSSSKLGRDKSTNRIKIEVNYEVLPGLNKEISKIINDSNDEGLRQKYDSSSTNFMKYLGAGELNTALTKHSLVVQGICEKLFAGYAVEIVLGGNKLTFGLLDLIEYGA